MFKNLDYSGVVSLIETHGFESVVISKSGPRTYGITLVPPPRDKVGDRTTGTGGSVSGATVEYGYNAIKDNELDDIMTGEIIITEKPVSERPKRMPTTQTKSAPKS